MLYISFQFPHRKMSISQSCLIAIFFNYSLPYQISRRMPDKPTGEAFFANRVNKKGTEIIECTECWGKPSFAFFCFRKNMARQRPSKQKRIWYWVQNAILSILIYVKDIHVIYKLIMRNNKIITNTLLRGNNSILSTFKSYALFVLKECVIIHV